jgi:hypothetical protein
MIAGGRGARLNPIHNLNFQRSFDPSQLAPARHTGHDDYLWRTPQNRGCRPSLRGPPLTETPRDLPRRGPPDDDPPPILGSWRSLYIAVLLHLAFWIGVFYVFTVEFDLPR